MDDTKDSTLDDINKDLENSPKNKKIIIIIALCIAIIFILIMGISNNSNKGPSSSNSTNLTLTEKTEIEHNLTTAPITCPVFDKGFFYVTPNYASFYNKNGDILWNEMFTLSNVVVAKQGEYMATTQYNVTSPTVYVFDTSGLIYSLQPNKKILKHSINENGYLSLIFEDNTGYQIQAYDNTGARVLTYTFSENNSIPVDASISSDNRYMAIPFFNYDSLTPVSKTVFLYLDKYDPSNESNDDAIFAGFDLNNTIPLMSTFIDDSLFLLTDKKIVRYNVVNGVVTEDFVFDLNNYLLDLDIINNKYVVIAFGNKINDISNFEPNSIAVFDLQGSIVSQTEPIENLDFITSADNGFLVKNNNTLTFYNLKCSPIFNFSHEQNITDAYVINKNYDTIITTSTTSIYEVTKTTTNK